MQLLRIHHVCVLFLALSPACCVGLSSRECNSAVKGFKRVGTVPEACPNPLCGHLRAPTDGKTFLERLSPECRATMMSMRSPEVPENRFGLDPNAFESTRGTHCPKAWGSTFPSSSVVVDTPGIHPFAMCTVPKAGCTSLRKLMHAVIHTPDPQPYNAYQQAKKAHYDPYPTLWHYTNLTHVEGGVFPTFIVGRNPYVRLLSGFLNKMIPNDHPGDNGPDGQFTLKAVNTYLKREPHQYWENSRQGFHKFVKTLKLHGIERINEHFGLQFSACGDNFNHEFRLRLEDQAQWFPCWEQGLNLTRITATGWQTFDQGQAYVRDYEEFKNENKLKGETHCYYKPASMRSCRDFYQATYPSWDGVSSVSSMSPSLYAVPLSKEIPTDKVMKRDYHFTDSASKWKHFYTQEIGDDVYELYRVDFEAFGYEREAFGGPPASSETNHLHPAIQQLSS